MKFLIIMPYYNRPKLVLNALESIRNLNYDNWELAVIDDGSDFQIIDLIKKYIPENKYNYYRIEDSKEEKLLRGGSMHGLYLNNAIFQLSADIVVPLCDDDALMPNYLNELEKFYNENPDVMYAYSHVICFNPYNEKPEKVKCNTFVFGDFDTPVQPAGRCDWSMVTFRRNVFIVNCIRYPFPQTKNLDESLFKQFYKLYGDCVYTGITGQYKAIYENQLGARKNIYDYND